MYAQHVQFTFRRLDKFYTIPGVVISVFVLIGVFAYVTYTSFGLFDNHLDHLNVVNFQRVLSHDASNKDNSELEKPEYKPELPFAFGFQDRSTGKGVKLDKTYGQFYINQNNKNKDESKSLEFGVCTDVRLTKGSDHMFCLNDFSKYKISFNDTVSITFEECIGTQCKDTATISKTLSNLNLEFPMFIKTLDLTNADIYQYYLNDKNYFSLVGSTQVDMYL